MEIQWVDSPSTTSFPGTRTILHIGESPNTCLTTVSETSTCPCLNTRTFSWHGIVSPTAWFSKHMECKKVFGWILKQNFTFGHVMFSNFQYRQIYQFLKLYLDFFFFYRFQDFVFTDYNEIHSFFFWYCTFSFFTYGYQISIQSPLLCVAWIQVYIFQIAMQFSPHY